MSGTLTEGCPPLLIKRETAGSVGQSLRERPHSSNNIFNRGALSQSTLGLLDHIAQFPVDQFDRLLGKDIVPESISRQHNHISILQLVRRLGSILRHIHDVLLRTWVSWWQDCKLIGAIPKVLLRRRFVDALVVTDEQVGAVTQVGCTKSSCDLAEREDTRST